jgi:hypothetical protein
MKANIKIYGLSDATRKATTLRRVVDVPEFKSLPAPLKANGKTYNLTISAETQLLDWFADNYNAVVVDYAKEHEVYTIMDATIELAKHKEKKNPNQKLIDLLRGVIGEDQYTEEMLATFAAFHERLKPTLKGLDNVRKLSIIMSAMGLSFEAANVATQNSTKMWVDSFKSTDAAYDQLMGNSKAIEG